MMKPISHARFVAIVVGSSGSTATVAEAESTNADEHDEQNRASSSFVFPQCVQSIYRSKNSAAPRTGSNVDYTDNIVCGNRRRCADATSRCFVSRSSGAPKAVAGSSR
jgi:hypothetical protein